MPCNRLLVCLGLLALPSLVNCSRKSDPVASTPPVRLFSGGQELLDATLRQRFFDHHPEAFYLPTAEAGEAAVYSAGGDSVRFAPFPLSYSVVRHGSQQLFYSSKPVLLLADKAALLADLVRYQVAHGPCGTPVCYEVTEVRAGTVAGTTLRLSYVQYCQAVRYSSQSQTLYGHGLYFNELGECPACRALIGDTLAIRTGTIELPMR